MTRNIIVYVVKVISLFVLSLSASLSSSSSSSEVEESYSYGYYFPADSTNPYSQLPINCTKQGYGDVKYKALCQQYIKDWIQVSSSSSSSSFIIHHNCL